MSLKEKRKSKEWTEKLRFRLLLISGFSKLRKLKQLIHLTNFFHGKDVSSSLTKHFYDFSVCVVPHCCRSITGVATKNLENCKLLSAFDG